MSTRAASASDQPVRVLTIDGPSGAGKGTVAQRLARELGLNLLDSGAVYRAAALHVLRLEVDLENEAQVVTALGVMRLHFDTSAESCVVVELNGEAVDAELRTETTANAASIIASLPLVRSRLLADQRRFRRPPGLVADGRDMGTVVFPDADLKVFLTANAAERARRRHVQLKKRGLDASLVGLTAEIQARDHRDSSRSSSPLKAANDALVIDSTDISIDEVVARVLSAWTKVG